MDIHLLASAENLSRLKDALAELAAEVIAVPPFEEEFLERGHAVHFRCGDGLHLDVMARMRGVGPFEEAWERRTLLTIDEGMEIPLLSLPDLVAAKKTQRDQDWPMIRRLVEANYAAFYDAPTPQRVRFWLDELRSPALLVEAVARFPDEARAAAERREAVACVLQGYEEEVQEELDEEMARERAADRLYWAPLRKELEELRRR
ncbi:MAG TPA: hypothetical protein VFX98_07965 [Longimicrobiaceae bacterium]|nr:hypothetical protein [Longimicrobiaceae bacterium]